MKVKEISQFQRSGSSLHVHDFELSAAQKIQAQPAEEIPSPTPSQDETKHTINEAGEYPKGAKLAPISLALCLAIFLISLDSTIIATAIPKITDQFHSLSDVGWYGSAYLLTIASFQLIFGKFYTVFSVKWVYLICIVIFELGSLVCGVAPNSTTFIVGRGVAGAGCASVFPGSLIIMAYSIPSAKRPIYTGFLGANYGLTSVCGPLLGGLFTDEATWRWCFFINLQHSEYVPSQLDIYGNLFFMPAIISVLLALQWGGSTYPWSDWRIILLFTIFAALLYIFICIQFRNPDTATVSPNLLARRSIWASAWFSFNLGSFSLIYTYFLPIWFQAVKGASPIKSGIMNLPMILAMVLMSVLSGVGVSVIGYCEHPLIGLTECWLGADVPMMILASVFMAVGGGLMTTFVPSSNHSMWIGYQVVAAIGLRLGVQQPMLAVQTVLPLPFIPVGTSIVIFAQTLGGALFVSIGQNVFTTTLISSLREYVPDLDPQIVLDAGATSIQQTIGKEYLAGVILAYNDAATRALLAGTIMASLTIVGALAMEWKSVKGTPKVKGGGGVTVEV